jgi:hypothetical protein
VKNSIFNFPPIISFTSTASQDNLPIHEDKSKGVYVKGLLEVYVSSTEEVYEVMRRGSENRVVASTSKFYL